MPRAIVDQIVASAPTGASLDLSDVSKWKQTPFVNGLHAVVEERDMPAFFSLMENANWMVANLATSLLRGDALKKYPEFNQVLAQYRKVWSDESRPLEVRLCVMYPLLDSLVQTDPLHAEFFDAIIKNVESFKTFALTYFPSPADVIPTAKSRIPTATPGKIWIYLCNALASSDKSETQEFIEEYKEFPSNPFVETVAKDLLTKFF